jgi:hypothetical protein
LPRQLLAHLVQTLGGERRGFLHQRNGAQLQRFDGDPTIDGARAHQHDPRRTRHLGQAAQHAEPVELRHHQIERDDVGLQGRALLERVEPVPRDTGDFDARRCRQHLAQHLARERRVIDDQHANGPQRGHAALR